VVLSAKGLVKARYRGTVLVNLHSVEVAGIEISALRVVHPGALVSVLRSLRAASHPFIQVGSNRRHLTVEFGTLLRCSFENVSVNAEDRLVGPRVDLVELDHVYVWSDV
jgi:hypothetical protein